MALFQKSVLNKFLREINDSRIAEQYSIYSSYFLNLEIQQNIRDSKEEQFQEGFLRELFVNVLGYTINPNPNYNLTTELKNETGAKKADGAIMVGGKAIGVIELKSTNTKDLESIRQQAFDYKSNQSECVYVVTSNFEKLRFYIDNAVDYEEFDLFTLSLEQFKLLYLCLHVDSIMAGIPKTAKTASLVKEENVTKKLYADYSVFKEKLFNSIIGNEDNLALANGTDEKEAKLILFKKTQKLMDRFLFIFFAEDRGLIPPNTISTILAEWEQLKSLDAYRPLYDRFKRHFEYINIGWNGDNYEIFAYNGGLFLPDEILDNITISDEVLFEQTTILTKYDFDSEVDVNILGHIFEHSLNEIESMNAELEGQEIDLKKTKRKKDGVFYTPKYITKYIVDSTIGKLCEEKKQELSIVEEDYLRGKKGRKKDTVKQLETQLIDYRDWLLQITIVDPACGSGAFLNQALEFLIREHRWIDEMTAKLFGGGLVFQDVENSILENNLYGVDINDESVEIAKLSLWLRTAQKGRKLTSLNNNIKCGNSLIDDLEVAGDKAFKWEEEFPKVFAKGGFDVVIGNPPYVKEATNKTAFDGLHEHYCYQGKMDLWYFFGVKAIEISKEKIGLTGFIAPNNWITNDGAIKFRNFILKNSNIIEFIDFGDFKVFDSAGIQTMIFILRRTSNNHEYEVNYSKVIEKKINHRIAQIFLDRIENEKFEFFKSTINPVKLLNNSINFNSTKIEFVLKKVSTKKNFNFDSNEIASGIDILQDFINKKHQSILQNTTIGDGVFNLSHEELNALNLNSNEKELIKPFYTTVELKRHYGNSQNRYWVIYTDSSFKNSKRMEEYPNIKKHLDKFSDIMTSVNRPYGLHRARNEDYFKGEKIFSLRKCSIRPQFTYTNFDTYVNRTFLIIKTDRINNKYLTGLLNSKLISFWLKNKGKMQGSNYQVDKTPLLELPLIKLEESKEKVILELVSKIIFLKSEKQKIIDNLSTFVVLKYNLIDKNLDFSNLYELDFKQFIAELKKKKVVLTLSEESEWMSYFNEKKAEAQELKAKIEATDNEIDLMVYKLYGLTYDEVLIVDPETSISREVYGG